MENNNEKWTQEKAHESLLKQVASLSKHLEIEIKANETLRREHKKLQLEKIDFVSLLKDYEQWEADIISEDKLWWPNRAQDVLRGKIYDRMLELQEKRNTLLKSSS